MHDTICLYAKKFDYNGICCISKLAPCVM